MVETVWDLQEGGDMKRVKLLVAGIFLTILCLCIAGPASATIIDLTIDGGDAIFLAGRTDLSIPPASDPWNYPAGMQRHTLPTPEEIQETLPPIIPVSPGDCYRSKSTRTRTAHLLDCLQNLLIRLDRTTSKLVTTGHAYELAVGVGLGGAATLSRATGNWRFGKLGGLGI